MFSSHYCNTPLALALAAALACTVDKGDDTGASTTTDPGTDSASSAPSTGGESTEGQPTTGINGGSEGTGTGGSEGSDTGDTGATGDNTPCIDTPQVLAVDAPSPLGFSAEELLVGKLGTRVTTLKFASEPLSLSDNIKGLELPLTVALRWEGGEVRFIDSEVNPDYDDSGNESGFPGECTDRLEVVVELDFITEGGEFDELELATLVATTVERASLQHELLPGLSGSLDPAAIYSPDEDPPWQVTSLQIAGTWDGALAGGSLLNEVQVGGDDGFVGFGPIASWGDEIP